MMKLRLALLAVLLLPISAFADSIVSASCAPEGNLGAPLFQQGIINTGVSSASCVLYRPGQGPGTPLYMTDAYASASVSLSIATNPAGWSTLSTNETAYGSVGIPAPGHALGTGNAARSQITFTDQLTTTGAVRAGYLQITISGGGSYDNAMRSLTTGIVSSSPFPVITEAFCDYQPPVSSYSVCFPGTNYYALNTPFAVQLGTPFTVEATGYIEADSYSGTEPADGQRSTSYQFRFFEADGVTPALVSEVPEPSTFFLLAGPAFCLLAFAKWRQRASIS